MSRSIRPILNRVIVLPDGPETISKGGIQLPDNVRDYGKAKRGTVRSVGSGRGPDGIKNEMEVCSGDIVIYNPHAGVDVEIGGTKLVILSEFDILAIVDSKE